MSRSAAQTLALQYGSELRMLKGAMAQLRQLIYMLAHEDECKDAHERLRTLQYELQSRIEAKYQRRRALLTSPGAMH